MKHMTSYVFNKDIKTIDDAVVKINGNQTTFLLILVTQASRKGITTTFIEKSIIGALNPHRICQYEITKLEDVLKFVCDDIHLLVTCIDNGIVIPK